MKNNNEIILSVKNLKTYIYVNNRCNRAVDGVSLMFTKVKLWESSEKVDVVKALLPHQLSNFFQNFLG